MWRTPASARFAYVATRPLGASFADWMGKSRGAGGLGWGSGSVALALSAAIVALVAYLAATRRDVQAGALPAHAHSEPHVRVEAVPESE